MSPEKRERLLFLLNRTPLRVDVARLESLTVREAGVGELRLLRATPADGLVPCNWTCVNGLWRSQPSLFDLRSSGLSCLRGSWVGFDRVELLLGARRLDNKDIENWYAAGLDVHTQVAEMFSCSRTAAKTAVFLAIWVPTLAIMLRQAEKLGVARDVAIGVFNWLRPSRHAALPAAWSAEQGPFVVHGTRKIVDAALGEAALTCFARDIEVRAIVADALLVADRSEIALDALQAAARADDALNGVRASVRAPYLTLSES